MSWPEAPYPPEQMRRRSRSRSPDRRPYDRYDREREWAEYERERAEWEYRRANPMGMRGRSRSPGAYDDRRMKRRRSMSPSYPYERDRYDPRPRYDDYHDFRGPPPGRYSPPRGYRQNSPPRSRFPDPYDMDHPATLRHFSEWYRATHPNSNSEDEAQMKSAAEADPNAPPLNMMKERYNKYRRHITNRQVQILFDHHKTSAWFQERYSLTDQYVSLRTRVRKLGLTGKIDQFIADLQEGKYDPPLDLDSIAPASVPGNNGTSSWAENGDAAKDEGQDPDASGMLDEPRPEDDMDINMFDQEANVEGVGVDSSSATPAAANGSTKHTGNTAPTEEVSVMPEGVQIMIRTIPPDIGRIKIEEVCSKIPGFMYLALGDPMQKRNYYRCGWIRLADDVDVSEVLPKLGEAKIDGFRMQVSHSNRAFTSKCRVTPSVAGSPERIQTDLENVRKLATVLEDEADRLAKTHVEGEEGDMDDVTEQKDRGSIAVEGRAKELVGRLEENLAGVDEERAEVKKNSIILDLYLAYLRNAFHCCYYCAAVACHDEELLRKCIKHIRGGPWKTGDSREERWVDWLNSKVALLIDRENVDPEVYGGKNYQKELSRVCEPHVKKEDESKFRCNVCTKLFKAESFVEKHIANKHAELVTTLTDIPFFNSFALDPHRIQPFTHAPPPTGNQQQPPSAYGLRHGGPPRDMMPNGGHFGYDMPPRQPYPHYTYPPPMPPPMPMGGPAYYGQYNPQPYAPSRRYSPPPGRRRLSERVGDRLPESPVPMAGGDNLPAKPMTGPGSERGGLAPPPPGKVKEDPRAAQGRKVSYMDMDEVAEGDVELSY